MLFSPLIFPLLLRPLAVLAQRVAVVDLWKPPAAHSFERLTARDGPLSTVVVQKPNKSMYWMNITIGTPGQVVTVQIDTGSRQTWVPKTGSSMCSPDLIDCATMGAFDSAFSKTYNGTGVANEIAFIDGSGVSGEWFYDTLSIGGVAVSRQALTLADTGKNMHEGIVGIGFPDWFPTINHNLAAQGSIASNAYSIWLNSLSAESGTVLFGGIDRSRYIAPLLPIPILPTLDKASVQVYHQPILPLTHVSTTVGASTTTHTAPDFYESAIIDTGTALTILQQPLANALLASLGAQYLTPTATYGTTIIPCRRARDPSTVTFGFSAPSSDPKISVPVSELVLPSVIATATDGTKMCQLGIYVSASEDEYPTILGDTFLRSAYVVYEVDKRRVRLAQTVFGDAGDGEGDVVEIGKEDEGGL